MASFCVVHDSPSTGAGPDVALFRKLSDKVFVLEGRHRAVSLYRHTPPIEER